MFKDGIYSCNICNVLIRKEDAGKTTMPLKQTIDGNDVFFYAANATPYQGQSHYCANCLLDLLVKANQVSQWRRALPMENL